MQLAASTRTRLLSVQLLGAVATGGTALAGLPAPVTVGVALLSGVIAYLATRALAIAPVHRLVADANHLAAGDLTHEITTGASGAPGQLQQALQQMSLSLRTVVQDVRTEVDQLSIAVAQIATGNQDLASRTESQASSLEQTAASMEQINGTVQHSADAAQQGAHLAQETSHITQRSNEAVLAVTQTMGGIAESSSRIGEIIHLIEGVAEHLARIDQNLHDLDHERRLAARDAIVEAAPREHLIALSQAPRMPGWMRAIGGWDAHNVTEDADLGVRLARRGYRTEIIETTTDEEANCRALPWVKQRSRWIKGYMMTWAVHMRQPRLLWRQLGPRGFMGFQALFLGTIAQFLLAPLLWSFMLLPFGFDHPRKMIRQLFGKRTFFVAEPILFFVRTALAVIFIFMFPLLTQHLIIQFLLSLFTLASWNP